MCARAKPTRKASPELPLHSGTRLSRPRIRPIEHLILEDQRCWSLQREQRVACNEQQNPFGNLEFGLNAQIRRSKAEIPRRVWLDVHGLGFHARQSNARTR